MRDDTSGHPVEATLHRVAEDGIEAAGAGIREHLEDCERCRREVEGIRRVLRAAGELSEGIAPGRDLWPGVEARVRAGDGSADGLAGPGGGAGAADTGPRPGSPRRLAGERTGLRAAAPWLAAAAAVVIAVTAGTTLWLAEGGDGTGSRTAATAAVGSGSAREGAATFAGPLPAAVADVRESYRPMVERLGAVLERRRDRLPPATRRVVERNLAIIDAAIAETEAALAGRPASAELARMLEQIYHRKIELLRRSTRLTAEM